MFDIIIILLTYQLRNNIFIMDLQNTFNRETQNITNNNRQNERVAVQNTISTPTNNPTNTVSNTITNTPAKSLLEKISFILLIVTLILSPFVFSSSNYISHDIVKSYTIVFGIIISCILYIISLYKRKTISCSRNPIKIMSILIVISLFISSLLSTSVQKSFIGQGFELGTFSFIAIMFISLFLVSKLVSDNKDRLLYIYGSFIISFILLAIFHIIRLFSSPSFLSFGIFNSSTATIIGKWFDLGIFSGIIFLLSFFALSLLSIKKSMKVLLWIILVLSAVLMFIVNSYIIWFVISLILFAYGVYQYLQTESDSQGFKKVFSKIPYFTLILFVLSSVFMWKDQQIANSLANEPLALQQTEISLPWQLTLDIVADTIKERPLFGAGPNRFGSEFLLHKPVALNSSDFWALEFSTGFSYISSFLVTQGVVGSLLWILFFIFFFLFGIRGLKKVKESFARFTIVSTFFISSFLWIISLLYNPSHVIVLCTFVMTGLYLSVLISEGIVNLKKTEIISGSGFKKIFIIVLTILLIVFISWLFIYTKKVIGMSYFQSGLNTLNSTIDNSVSISENKIKKAISWNNIDLYNQALSEVYIIQANSLVQKLQEQTNKDPKSVDQGLVKELGSIISLAATSTLNAINIDPTNYYNYISSARVFEFASSLKFTNAYESAKARYSNALSFNPYSPLLYLNLAQLEASNEKMDEAKKMIGIALQLKQNYTEAIFLLSQIQVSEGNTKDAIISAQVMTQINPNNPLIFFQLGLLYYNDKDYKNAVIALKQAVDFNPQYANARYFLGLSLARLNKNIDAIEQFEEITKTNPDNEEVSVILSNLKAGKSAFANVKSPIDNKPENRKTLPVN